MQQIIVRRLDGSQVETSITHQDSEMDCAVVRLGADEAVIIRNGRCWREVVKHQRGDIITYRLGHRQPRQAEVIHVLEPTADNPLTYVILPQGARSAEVVTPAEVLEKEIPGSEFHAIYGPAPRRAEHRAGDTITYHDPGQPNGRNTGLIVYVIAATSTEPMRYVVSPDIELFPVEIAANEIIEDERS